MGFVAFQFIGLLCGNTEKSLLGALSTFSNIYDKFFSEANKKTI